MHTAIRAFDDRASADEARGSLLRAGFIRHEVHVERGSYVLVVDAESDAEAQRAHAVLHGPASTHRDPDLEHAPGLRYADKK
jgi:hypothetical protein